MICSYLRDVGDAVPYIVNARFACSSFITIKFIACVTAFPLPKKIGRNPHFSGTLFFAYATFNHNSVGADIIRP